MTSLWADVRGGQASGVASATWATVRGGFNDPGAVTETATGALAFAGLAMAGAATRSHTLGGAMHFAGLAMAGATHRNETSTAAMHFAGLAMAGATHRNETSTAALHFGGLAFTASAHEVRSATGALHFAGLAMAGATHRNETSTAALHFGGLAFTARGAVVEAATGALAFGPLAFAGVAYDATITGGLAFGGLAFRASLHGAETSHAALAFTGMSFAGLIDQETTRGGLAFGPLRFDAGGGARVAEMTIAVMASPPIFAQVPELDVSAVATPGDVVARVTETDVAALIIPEVTTLARTTELDVSVLAYVGPCATSRCQVWKITRRDGQVFGFTSLDRDIDWLGVTYKTCKSLSTTAASSSADLKSAGDVELTGILDDASISDEDLYSGIFDDARVEVWVIPYDGQADDQAPFRQAAGWMGKVTRGEHNFSAEVIGPGGKMAQAGVVDFVTPGCRWDFGVVDSNGIGCPVDVDALSLTNVEVTSSTLRSLVEFEASDPGGVAVWDNGKVVWQTGRNAGVTCQVETVDFAAGALSLWDLAPYPPQPGDLFTLKPGCPKTPAPCKAYGVFVSFGGFPDVPGPDALQSNADSLFT